MRSVGTIIASGRIGAGVAEATHSWSAAGVASPGAAAWADAVGAISLTSYKRGRVVDVLIDEGTNGVGKFGAVVVDTTLVTSHTRRVLVECRHDGW